MLSHSPSEKSSPLRAGQVAGSVTGAGSLILAASPEVAEFCQIVEFRVDALPGEVSALLQAMRSCPVPSLLTVRAFEEGGVTGMDDEARGKLFLELLPEADLVDVEIASLGRLPEVMRQARTLGVPVVASFHDFGGTPEVAELRDRMAAAEEAGASAVKFATTLRDSRDLTTLMTIQESSPLPCSTMGMGPLGRVSRLLLARLGSVLNYGYLDRPTVTGQWEARRLRQLIAEVGGWPDP